MIDYKYLPKKALEKCEELDKQLNELKSNRVDVEDHISWLINTAEALTKAASCLIEGIKRRADEEEKESDCEDKTSEERLND